MAHARPVHVASGIRHEIHRAKTCLTTWNDLPSGAQLAMTRRESTSITANAAKFTVLSGEIVEVKDLKGIRVFNAPEENQADEENQNIPPKVEYLVEWKDGSPDTWYVLYYILYSAPFLQKNTTKQPEKKNNKPLLISKQLQGASNQSCRRFTAKLRKALVECSQKG